MMESYTVTATDSPSQLSPETTWRIPLALLLCTLCALLTPIAWAEGDGSEVQSTLRWHGFINQGYINTDHNQFFGDSESGTWDFTDIGIGFSTKPFTPLLFSAQGLYQRAGETSPNGVQLDYALADLTLLNQAETGLGLRAGKIKNPYGFYNETRDISASRPSILLPESIYIDALRELFHTVNGVGLYGYQTFGNQILSIDTTVGKPQVDSTSQDAILTIPLPGSVENEDLWVGRAMLEDDSGQWRIGFSYAQFGMDYRASTADLATDGQTDIELKLLSIEYNSGNWQWVGEYQLRDVDYRDIFAPGFEESITSEAYYLQTSYRYGQHWQWLLRYDQVYIDKDDKSGSERSFHPDGYATDITLSLRYQFDQHWLASIEVHRIDGTAWLSQQENPIATDQAEQWTLFAAQVSWRF